MKISREARQEARSLYRACLKDGFLVPERMAAVVAELLQRKPRGYLAIADRIRALVALELDRRTHIVRSAVDLPDQGQSIFAALEKSFGPPLAREYQVRPEMIGGMTIQVGSDIWDGSIQRKLQKLTPVLN